MHHNKTILATAYAVNPYKGSEDGMGWNFICQIARFNKVIAITRENNRPHIEKFMAEHPDERYSHIRFLYFDLPYWIRFWKKGSRGAMLYYWMWQRALPHFILKQKVAFDIVHNVNFHNDWTPSYLWKLNKPFVWGPIGHHPIIPSHYLHPYKKTYWIKDRLTWLVKIFFWKLSPALRNTKRHTDHILCMNTSVSGVLRLPRGQYSIIPSVASEDFGASPRIDPGKFTLISAGRLVPLKGFDLTILSFARFVAALPPGQRVTCELIIVGSGPEKKYYEQLVQDNNITGQVRFIEWMPREALMELYKRTTAFLFPSHEGAGMVVSEALSFGLPVVCLKNSGPGEFIDETCGLAVSSKSYEGTIQNLQEAIQKLYHDPDLLSRLSKGARKRFEQYFHWDRRGEQLNSIYQHLVA